MKKRITFLVFLMSSAFLVAQDGHYSQYQNAPLFTNPANTGGEPKDVRVGINYRNQGAQGASPYRHFGAFLDYRLKNLGIGVLLNQNDAGDASLQRNQLALSMGFHKKLSGGRNELALGASLGFIQHQFDPNSFTYDNQYGALGFNAAASSGEIFEFTNRILPDVTIGGKYRFQFSPANESFGGMLGLSFAHLNRPGASFYNDLLSYPMRTSFQAALFYELNSELSIHPQIQWMSQQQARELLLSLHAHYEMTNQTQLQMGLGIRKGNALILYGGLKRNGWQLGVSYDINTSPKTLVRNAANALELSAMINLNKRENKETPEKRERDLDRDGVPDKEDDCPTIPGEIELAGCPKEKETKGIRDIDGDGVSDDNDLCPYQPGLVRYQGCNDKDADSVWDHLDACPSLPGSVDNYGCPDKYAGEIDSDGDGVIDRMDKCVYTRGTPQLLGCPDTDKDGISDMEDACPYVYGDPRNNGCPAKNVAGSSKRIGVEVIEFATGKALIRPEYYPMLDRLAYELRFNEDYHLQLEGHTDDEGGDLFNYQLSQRRAFAVQQYLMERNLDQDRISITYYGESRPKATNSEESGKQRNRRTELVLIKR